MLTFSTLSNQPLKYSLTKWKLDFFTFNIINIKEYLNIFLGATVSSVKSVY